ncbi:hypothetical protein IscW_ISCW008346 [Ixodes scapularis]|uniref:Uncharacterized protein n=1 Tax=Ixodes scapularis TaxID=6945 RepID=B7PUL5_IXOSC|nr:hypothetical protein IscW_ISCW008346 [Ixodes scapularis]|eukprot:XP_002406274.1 hypothetical protein IscW_ISCW008346 [Ixodes scapularis]
MSTFDLTRPADCSESEDDEDYVPSGEESERDLTDCENDAESDVEAATNKKGKKGKAAGVKTPAINLPLLPGLLRGLRALGQELANFLNLDEGM